MLPNSDPLDHRTASLTLAVVFEQAWIRERGQWGNLMAFNSWLRENCGVEYLPDPPRLLVHNSEQLTLAILKYS
jgi:hypothetical protein